MSDVLLLEKLCVFHGVSECFIQIPKGTGACPQLGYHTVLKIEMSQNSNDPKYPKKEIADLPYILLLCVSRYL